MFSKCDICPYAYCTLHFGDGCHVDVSTVIKDAIDAFIRGYNQRESDTRASRLLFFKKIG